MATPRVRLVSGPSLSVDYTPSTAKVGGDVVVHNGIATFVERDIAANAMGSAYWAGGVWAGQKITGAMAIDDVIYWNSTGDPNTGTAGTGAFTNVPATGLQAVGYCTKTAASGDDEVQFVKINNINSRLAVATVAVGGTAQANANAVSEGFTVVTGADNTAAVKLPSAAAGMVCILKSTTSGKVLQVFPATADKINGAAANAVYNMANLSQRTFVARDDTDWYTAPETIT